MDAGLNKIWILLDMAKGLIPLGKAHSLLEEAQTEIVLKKRPVAWRCRDYGDGWIIFQEEAEAWRYHDQTGAELQGLYIRDGR